MHFAAAYYKVQQAGQLVKWSFFFRQVHTTKSVYHDIQLISTHYFDPFVQYLVLHDQHEQIVNQYCLDVGLDLLSLL